MNGFINLIKPSGMSSAYAVGAVKKKFHLPCGHMGTLDPMASGVLPIGVYKASRLFQFQLDKEKTYIARFRFGFATDTLDVTGEITDKTAVIPTKAQIENSLKNFIGEIDQVPPKYSAKCIDGKRGYQLARRGVEFTLEPKKVNIKSIELLSQTAEDEFEFKIDCGGGTYIRSLARDIGVVCNSLGVMSSLIRTKSGVFTIENGVNVEEFVSSTDFEKYLLPADIAVDFPKLVLTKKQAQKIFDGVYEDYGFKDGLYRVYNGDEFWGVGEAQKGKLRIKAYVK